MRYLALLIILGCSIPESRSFSERAKEWAPVTDAVIEAIEPRLAKIEEGLAGFEAGVDTVEKRRIQKGLSTEEPYDWREVLIITGAILSGMFGTGLATYKKVMADRNKTRKEDLARVEEKVKVASHT